MTLRLPFPVVDELPSHIAPQASVECPTAFDHPDWHFSVNWDGMRAMLFAHHGTIELQNERLIDITNALPELQSLAAQIPDGTIIDGIVVTLDKEGRPDITALWNRMLTGESQPKVVYLATDIVTMSGTSTCALPFDERQRILHQAISPGGRLQIPDQLTSDGHALARASAERGLPALLARRRQAPYRCGLATLDRLVIPLQARAQTIVLGARMKSTSDTITDLILGQYHNGCLVHVGTVERTWADGVNAWLQDGLSSLSVAQPLLQRMAPVSGTIRWIYPSIIATIRHQGRRRDKTFRNPYYVAVRDDVPLSHCHNREAVPAPRTAEMPSPFSPTVLIPLPLASA